MGCTSSRETVIQNNNNNRPNNDNRDSRNTSIHRHSRGMTTTPTERMMQRDPLFFADPDLNRNEGSDDRRRRLLHRFIRDGGGRVERRYSPHPEFFELDNLSMDGLIGRRPGNVSGRIEFESEGGSGRRENHVLGSFDEFRFARRRGDDHLDRLRSDLETFELLFQTLLRHSNDQHGDSLSQVCPPASKSVMERLPTMKISKRDFEDEPKKECCICFLDFEVSDEVCRLPCGHIFHEECVSEWLRKKCTCPECRWELETDDQRYEVERIEKMKTRKLRVKDHELDRLCIEALQVSPK